VVRSRCRGKDNGLVVNDISGEGQALLPLVPPRVAVIAVTFRGDDVILVRRKNEPQRDTWGFPGGSVEADESLHDATLRELREETGVRAEVVGWVDVVEVREVDHTGRHYHFVLIAMLCRYLHGDLTPGDDAAECRWLRIPEGLLEFQGRLAEHVARVARLSHRRLRHGFPEDAS